MTKNYFDAEDLAQDTFISAYRAMDSFLGGNKKAWISRIATNKSLDYLKKGERKNLLTDNTYFYELKSNEMTPEEVCLDIQVQEHVRMLCENLKQPYDEIALKHFYQGVSANDLSKELDKPLKTIQTQIYRAKAMLKELWRKEYL